MSKSLTVLSGEWLSPRRFTAIMRDTVGIVLATNGVERKNPVSELL